MSKIPYNKILKEEFKEKYISIVHKFCYIYIYLGEWYSVVHGTFFNILLYIYILENLLHNYFAFECDCGNNTIFFQSWYMGKHLNHNFLNKFMNQSTNAKLNKTQREQQLHCLLRRDI